MPPRAVPITGDQKAVRLCPRCGYRGAELQGARGRLVISCPSCREDLYSRPARSYLEMEGFLDPSEYGWVRATRAEGAHSRRLQARPKQERRVGPALAWTLRVALATAVCVGLFLAVSLATVAALSS